jgi:predicted DNA-binding WGR domain protein
MTRRLFHLTEGSETRFWAISLRGTRQRIESGRVGGSSRSQEKAFVSLESARTATEKLIAQKVKQGYVEVQEEAGAESVSGPPPELLEAVAGPAGVGEPAKACGASCIEFAAEDWLWATWRPRPEIAARPAEPGTPFDQKQCLRRLDRITHAQRSPAWDWFALDHAVKLGPSLAREEAHFWLSVLTLAGSLTPDALRARLVGETFSGQQAPSEVAALIAGIREPHYKRIDLLWRVLPVLLSPCDVAGLLLDEKVMGVSKDMHVHARSWLVAGGIIRLARRDIDQLSERVRPHVGVSGWPTSPEVIPPAAYFLAARLGLHEEMKTLVENWPHDRYVQTGSLSKQEPQLIVFGLGSARLVEYHMRRLRLPLQNAAHVRAWLAHTELTALDHVRDSILGESRGERALYGAEAMIKVLCRVKSPVAAPHLLALKRGDQGVPARAWLEEEVAHAVTGLVPVVGERGKLGEAAIEYLREAYRRGFASLIEAEVEKADLATADRVRRLVLTPDARVQKVFDDPSTPEWLREALKAAPAERGLSLPAWGEPQKLPPVVLGDSHLGPDQVRVFLGALKATPPGGSHPLIRAIRAHADSASLEALAWHLFDRWQETGALRTHQWVLNALAHLGGETSARRLGASLRAWEVGEDRAKRRFAREAGLDCLVAIGNDASLVQLSIIAQDTRLKKLQERARWLLNDLARVLNLTPEQLEDRTVPTLGLDERGSRTFDFGPRRFQVVLSTDLKPLVRDEDGLPRNDLPRPGSKDDPARAAEAVEGWKNLKKQLREVLKVQSRRLEQAMVNRRRWPPGEFETLLARHALMTNLAQRLLFAAHDEKGEVVGCFRVTEERDYAGRDDNPYSLAGVAQVSLIHPILMSGEERTVWGELFADYEIAQPFPQLGRRTGSLEPSEAGDSELKRFLGRQVPGVYMIGILEAAGWERDASWHGCSMHQRKFPAAGVTASINYQPGIVFGGNLRDAEVQTITHCYILPDQRDGDESETSRQLGRLDPVVLSEVLADLTALAARGT